jgi:uncharacterized protein YbaR (Trm112 family)
VLRLSFLFICLCLVHPLFAYTVVLKSGKCIEGELIGQDQSTIQLKDIKGLRLSFKKDLLDLALMERLNHQTPTGKVGSAQAVQKVKPEEKSLVQLAREARASRTGRARVLRRQDLHDVTEITVLGSAYPVTDESPVMQKSEHRKEERYWRDSARALRKDLQQLQEKKWRAEDACTRAEASRKQKSTKLHQEPMDLASVMRESVECERVRNLQDQIRQAELRLDDFLELARRSEVPRHWVE